MRASKGRWIVVGYTETWSIKLSYELFYLALRTDPFSIYQIIWMKKKTLFLQFKGITK